MTFAQRRFDCVRAAAEPQAAIYCRPGSVAHAPSPVPTLPGAPPAPPSASAAVAVLEKIRDVVREILRVRWVLLHQVAHQIADARPVALRGLVKAGKAELLVGIQRAWRRATSPVPSCGSGAALGMPYACTKETARSSATEPRPFFRFSSRSAKGALVVLVAAAVGEHERELALSPGAVLLGSKQPQQKRRCLLRLIHADVQLRQTRLQQRLVSAQVQPRAIVRLGLCQLAQLLVAIAERQRQLFRGKLLSHLRDDSFCVLRPFCRGRAGPPASASLRAGHSARPFSPRRKPDRSPPGTAPLLPARARRRRTVAPATAGAGSRAQFRAVIDQAFDAEKKVWRYDPLELAEAGGPARPRQRTQDAEAVIAKMRQQLPRNNCRWRSAIATRGSWAS